MSIPMNRPAPNPAPREWLSLQEAAAIYGISVDTLRRRIATGRLPASRFGARIIRVRIADLDQLYRPVTALRRPLRRAW